MSGEFRAPMPSRFFKFPNHRLRPPDARSAATRLAEAPRLPSCHLQGRQLGHFSSQRPVGLGRGAGKGGFRCEAVTVPSTKSQASCKQAGNFVSFARNGNKSICFKRVEPNPTNRFTIHLLGRYAHQH